MNRECFHSKKLIEAFVLKPHFGDKKPESRYISFNSASQTFVLLWPNIILHHTDCQRFIRIFFSLFVVPVAKNNDKLSDFKNGARVFLKNFKQFFSLRIFGWSKKRRFLANQIYSLYTTRPDNLFPIEA
jgi:hypothetical protein